MKGKEAEKNREIVGERRFDSSCSPVWNLCAKQCLCFRKVSDKREKTSLLSKIFTLDGTDARKSSITIISPDGK